MNTERTDKYIVQEVRAFAKKHKHLRSITQDRLASLDASDLLEELSDRINDEPE